MLNKPLAFEQDKNAIFLRNKEMYHHYSKLDSIRNRKNTYLPEISSEKGHFNLKKNLNFLEHTDILKRPRKLQNEKKEIKKEKKRSKQED